MAQSSIPVMGNNLKKLRRAQDWTQEQAAAAFGLSKGGYIKIERSERGLDTTRIEQAARIYNVPEYEVFTAPAPIGINSDTRRMRFDLIRGAFIKELTRFPKFDEGRWARLANSPEEPSPADILDIVEATQLPPEYVRRADVSGLSHEAALRLLGALHRSERSRLPRQPRAAKPSQARDESPRRSKATKR